MSADYHDIIDCNGTCERHGGSTRRTFERRRLKVYVAGPISKGDRYDNVHAGIRWGRRMVRDGLAPLVPHLDNFMFPHPDDLDWNTALEWDLEWVASADAVFRIPGESTGADLECSVAVSLGIPVFEVTQVEVTAYGVVGSAYVPSEDIEDVYARLLAYADRMRLCGIHRERS